MRAFLPLGCLSVFLYGCVSYRGKMYWAWAVPGWPVESACVDNGAAGGSVVRVDVRDEVDGALPGVAVRISRPGSRPGQESLTDAHGSITMGVEPGQWEIDVTLVGFRHGHYTLMIAADQTCTVTFHLALDSTSTITVT